MWEPINPSEGETRSLVKLQTCRILLIVRFVYDILRYSWNFLSEKKIRRIIQKRRRRILDRSIDSEFLYSSIPRLYSLFFSLKISTKFPRKRLRQSERIDPTLATLPHRSIAQGVDQKMEFFSSSRRRNLFIERIHSSDRRTFQSWARATFLNRSGRKEKMDRWRNAFLINAFRTHARAGDESSTTIRRLSSIAFSPPPVKSPPFSLLSDSLTLLPTSRLLSKELSSPETRVSPPFAKAQSFTTSPTTFALAFCVCTHDAPLPLVHTSVPRKMSICRANDSLAQYYAIETPDFLCSSRHGLLISIPCTGTNFRPFVRNVCIFEGCALVRSCCFEIYFLAYISFQEFSFLIIIYIFRYIYFILDGKDILSRKKIAWLWSFVFLFIHMYHVYNTLLSWFKSNTNVL